MSDREKLRVLLPHWIEHNRVHAGEFRQWAQRGGPVEELILDAAQRIEQANARLEEALEGLGGPLEHYHAHEHSHEHGHEHSHGHSHD